MELKVDRVDTWAASIEDGPGKLASKLNALTGAGVNLEFIITRRAPEKPGTGVMFVTPIRGPAQILVAQQVGFTKTKSLHTLRIEGPNRPGHGLNIVETLAKKGINVSGITAAAIGKKFVAHIALSSAKDAAKALKALRPS